MSRAILDDLAEVTEALYEAELARVQDILRDVATRVLGEIARDVLITEIARQDV
jgi:hypothetical protein